MYRKGKTPQGNVFQFICRKTHDPVKGDDLMAQLTIRLTDQEKQFLMRQALHDDMTVSQILRKLIRKYIKETDNDTPVE